MKREDYNRILRLYPKQKWLVKKESELFSLLQHCDLPHQKELVFELLNEFIYVDLELLEIYLENIAEYIVNSSGFTLERTIITALAWEGDPDSSQMIIQLLRPWMTRKGWNNVAFASNVPKGMKLLNKYGYDQVILVDEFLGTGRTAEIRIEYLRQGAVRDLEIKACFVAGMKFGLCKISKLYDDVFCTLELDQAITDKYSGIEKTNAIRSMHQLETKLLNDINGKKLKDYKFGFSKTQALYSSYGNIPNSVFPIFWWPYDNESKNRNVLFIRNETGLEL
ncbi:hypothetical protein GU926_00350 [Nibribacter ruber]|uniref:PRTase-CE domain-containing protein n=1 Tax=Nibribacter ruber TaxID=2698458 RepID=A0A6P1NUI2_9BACT|nr:hypothetical protein [Nibribacter ruber]QHL85974.1 hypothetical protein GU926_00350 [Nibribacter ruber]